MKWKADPIPEHHDRRTRTRFAYLPVLTTNGYWLWLERYVVKEEYCAKYCDPYWCILETRAKP